MKTILGLDIGTNSIGWSLVDNENSKILGMGSRIIPMGSDKLDYERGIGITKNAERRTARTARKMNKRYKQRRNKLIFILSQLGMLPSQLCIDGDFPDAEKIQNLRLLPIKKGTLQLNSIEQYKLRSNAVTTEVTLPELGKIIYQLNQLRGYSGGNNEDDTKNKKEYKTEDEEETKVKRYEAYSAKFILKSIIESDEKFKSRKKGDENKELNYFLVYAEDEEGKAHEGKTQLQNLKQDEEVELEIRIKRNKKGEIIRTDFALPNKTNWRKAMEEFRDVLKISGDTLGQYFYKELTKDKWYKIRNRVVLRMDYIKEFDAIWNQQSKPDHHAILNDCPKEILEKIVGYIFPGKSESQKNLRNEGLEKGLYHIIRNQVIYYQRELKPQTDLISGCSFEKEKDKDGKSIHRVLPTSHPLYQENRIWEQLNRLSINSKYIEIVKGKEKIYYFERPISIDIKVDLYRKLQTKKEIGFNEVIKPLNLVAKQDYLNGLHSKAKLKGCDTLISISKIFADSWNELVVKDKDILTKIWDILFNKTGNEYDIESKKVSSLIDLLSNFFNKESAQNYALILAQKISFPRRYGSLSEKAILNILPLMRCGDYYNKNKVPQIAKENIDKLKNVITNEGIIEDLFIEPYMVTYIDKNPDILAQGGLQYAFASSLIYGKHTAEKISVKDAPIKNYHDIKFNPQTNLRNPIVEQLLNETLQVIKAIWKQYKINREELEIRVELARELKNSAAEREKIYKGIIQNEKINAAVKKRLIELRGDATPSDIDKYKLWSRQAEEPFPAPKKSGDPTPAEIEKMLLWEKQSCLSPYTRKPIPLSKLFTKEYEVDHIIPKSRYFDDSIANKVVCESEINDDKGNRTAWEYINIGSNKHEIMNVKVYTEFIENLPLLQGKKKRNLLLNKIPDNFIERQIKTTQYISIAVKNELAKIVGSDNVKTSTGAITDYLRTHWGLKKLFMRLTEDRFKQMELWAPNESWITNEVKKDENGNDKHIYQIKHWSKRYDHRHHAIDALIVALTTQKHIYRLNDLNKAFQDWLKENKGKINLQIEEGETELEAFTKLNEEGRVVILQKMDGLRNFEQPFTDLIKQAEGFLKQIIISHKPVEKLSIRKDKNNKFQVKTKGALHEATIYGKLRDAAGNISNIDVYRIPLSKLTGKNIDKIISESIKEELKEHLKNYDSPKEAFTGEGLEVLNKKRFSPITSIKISYKNDEKKQSSLKPLYDHNPSLTIKTGDNYLFAIMEKDEKRCFDIFTFFDAAKIANEELKKENKNFTAKIEETFIYKNDATKVLFTLKQNNLVYLPIDSNDPILNASSKEEFEKLKNENAFEFSKRIYKVTDFTDGLCSFLPHNYATTINVKKEGSENIEADKNESAYERKKKMYIKEFGSYGDASPFVINKDWIDKNINKSKYKPIAIQSSCIKLHIDWLGNVLPYWL